MGYGGWNEHNYAPAGPVTPYVLPDSYTDPYDKLDDAGNFSGPDEHNYGPVMTGGGYLGRDPAPSLGEAQPVVPAASGQPVDYYGREEPGKLATPGNGGGWQGWKPPKLFGLWQPPTIGPGLQFPGLTLPGLLAPGGKPKSPLDLAPDVTAPLDWAGDKLMMLMLMMVLKD